MLPPTSKASPARAARLLAAYPPQQDWWLSSITHRVVKGSIPFDPSR